MYSIKIKSKPTKCKDCLFYRETNPAVIGYSGRYCSIRIKLIENDYKVSSWCPITKNNEEPSTLVFKYKRATENYVAKGTNNKYSITFWEHDNDLSLSVTPSLEIITIKNGTKKLKTGNKEFKKLFNELVEEAQLYENSCYAPVRAKRKNAE